MFVKYIANSGGSSIVNSNANSKNTISRNRDNITGNEPTTSGKVSTMVQSFRHRQLSRFIIPPKNYSIPMTTPNSSMISSHTTYSSSSTTSSFSQSSTTTTSSEPTSTSAITAATFTTINNYNNWSSVKISVKKI